MATRDLAISGRQSEADLPQAGNVLIPPFQATAPWDVRDVVPLPDYRLNRPF
jgi:hypothetical protein